jgi:hypothetical protein
MGGSHNQSASTRALVNNFFELSVMEGDPFACIFPPGGTSWPSWSLTCGELHLFLQRRVRSLPVH